MGQRGRRSRTVASTPSGDDKLVGEEVVVPPLMETAVEGFRFEAKTDAFGGSHCKVQIEADVEKLDSPTRETSGGFTTAGTRMIGVEEERGGVGEHPA